MQLVRLGKAGFSRTEDLVTRSEEEFSVRVFFRGPENTSDFRVDFQWEDVEKLIFEFDTMKNPSAIALRQAKALAIGARRSGWIPKTES